MNIKKFSFTTFFLLFLLVFFQNASAQEFPAGLLNALPEAAPALVSTDVRERAAILNKLVVPVPDSCTGEQRLPLNLEKSDYEFAVGKILELDLSGLNEKNDGETWGKIEYLIARFQMNGQLKTLAKYLDHPETNIQAGIIFTIKSLKAKELDTQIAPLLDSPEKFIREITLETLIELESKKAVPVLIKRLAEPDEYYRRYGAMMSLVKVKGVEAAPFVSKILFDENENNRYWAIDTLVKLEARTETAALWKFTETETNPRFVGFALAALLSLGDKRAVPAALKTIRETAAEKGNEYVLEFIGTLKPKILIPELIALHYQKERFFEAGEPEVKMRRIVYNLIYIYRAREAVPIYREALFGSKIWGDTEKRFQEGVAQILLELKAVEAVDDLIVGLRDTMKNKTAQYYDLQVGNLAYNLAKFGDKKANRLLLEVVEENQSFYRGLIIAQMNKQLNPELRKKLETAKIPMIYIESIETFSEKASAATGLRLEFEKDPAAKKALCEDADFNLKNGIPCTYSNGLMSVMDSLDFLFNDRRNRDYTWIVDGERVRVLSVVKAVEWWKQKISAK